MALALPLKVHFSALLVGYVTLAIVHGLLGTYRQKVCNFRMPTIRNLRGPPAMGATVHS
jgi:hypothetical protein